jgi:hypothetical protein
MDKETLKTWIDSFVRAEDLIALREEEPDWLLRGLLLPGTYMIVFGKEGLGKSRLVYQLAHAFQTGEAWFGLEICKTGRVLYLEADMSPEQSAALVRDATASGMEGGDIVFPSAYGSLNVLEPMGEQGLALLQERFNPMIVVVDTATDVFDGDEGNEAAKQAIRAFRQAFENAGLVFILHERKKSQFLQAKGIEDEDAYLGAGEWSRKASGVVRLQGVNEQLARLAIRKTRDIVPWKSLQVVRNSHGFFETHMGSPQNAKEALHLWPNFPGVNGDRGVTTISGVCRSIEKGTEGRFKADTVRRAFQRAREEGIRFHWLSQIEDES